MARVLVILAQGAEEMETTIIVDVLRRAQIDVVLAGLDGAEAVTCSRGVHITPDLALAQVDGDFDAVVLPGGNEGAERLGASPHVGSLLSAQWKAGRIVAAICAAPTALLRHGIAKGHEVTSHPGVRASLEGHYRTSDSRVIEDGQLVTSQGPGTSFEFALRLVAKLKGADVAAKVQAPMVL